MNSQGPWTIQLANPNALPEFTPYSDNKLTTKGEVLTLNKLLGSRPLSCAIKRIIGPMMAPRGSEGFRSKLLRLTFIWL